ncbi:hypothetical protein LOK74_08245 [Brevibacillus humidisoli]|uniref:hypothetical protein n=1 Tax=Brevibacillus humidisoli TaxID=2895522 RepID=UPI001E40447B|nr:hypothetical protein [Brevibacillus humidisoli]UFJ42464.1 hypothetical protein LOK74_08245 [Brevibacillus humidisoli]
MKQAHKLPVTARTGFFTECYHNFRLSIVLAHPNLMPWYYGQFCNLILQASRDDQFPFVRFEDHLDIYSEVLEERAVIEADDWVDVIRQAVSAGEYILLYFNWKHIKSSDYYQQKDIHHEALLYAFDDETETFELLAYDVEGSVYGVTRISYDDCRQELERLVAEDMRSQKWFAYYGFPVQRISVKQTGPTEVNLKRLYFALDRARVKASPHETEVFAMGFHIYAYLAEFFNQLAQGRYLHPSEHVLWNIVLNKMIQHKKVMVKRLDFLAAGGSSPFLQRTRSFYEQARKHLVSIMGKSLRYQQGGGTSLLQEIGEEMREVYELEKRASPLLMEYLVDRQLKQL